MYSKPTRLTVISIATLCLAGRTLLASDPIPTPSASDGTPEPMVKWYQLQNVTIPPECSLRSQANITKPPAIFVDIKLNGDRIMQSSTEKGWTVDYGKKGRVFPVSDDPDAIYTIQVWDDCWWNQNIVNITGLKGAAFADTIYQKGGQFDTREQLLSVQFREVPAP